MAEETPLPDILYFTDITIPNMTPAEPTVDN